MAERGHCTWCGVVRDLDEDGACDECIIGIGNCPVDHVQIAKTARRAARAHAADELDTFGWSVENLRAFQGRLRGEVQS